MNTFKRFLRIAIALTWVWVLVFWLGVAYGQETPPSIFPSMLGVWNVEYTSLMKPSSQPIFNTFTVWHQEDSIVYYPDRSYPIAYMLGDLIYKRKTPFCYATLQENGKMVVESLPTQMDREWAASTNARKYRLIGTLSLAANTVTGTYIVRTYYAPVTVFDAGTFIMTRAEVNPSP